MKIEKIARLVELADNHQTRLEKIHTLLDEDSSFVSPSTKGMIVSQILDLSTMTSHLLTSEMSGQPTAYNASYAPSIERLNYTLSPEDLDAELESMYDTDDSDFDDDEEDEDDTQGEVDERR